MEIFKQLNKKGYKHYYEGTVEELDSMDKDNQHLHSEIMQVIMWLYEKHGIWIWVERFSNLFRPYAEEIGDERFGKWEVWDFAYEENGERYYELHEFWEYKDAIEFWKIRNPKQK